MITVILCEGYYDRAFWKGLLHKLGCKESRFYGSQRITGGAYGFENKRGEFIKVVPCGGKEKIPTELTRILKRLVTDPVDRIVVNMDPDGEIFTDLSCKQSIHKRIKDAGHESEAKDRHFCVKADQGVTIVTWALWGTKSTGGEHLPKQQTLERLAIAALLAAYPERGENTTNFLTSDPQGDGSAHKQHAFAHMAKWYGDKGCEYFFEGLWHDDTLNSCRSFSKRQQLGIFLRSYLENRLSHQTDPSPRFHPPGQPAQSRFR